MNNKSIYFKNLDLVRFIAAIMVLFNHTIIQTLERFYQEKTTLLIILKTLFNGGTGVSIFFNLSGFLITFLIITEIDYKGKLNLIHFYIRRILRIWPLYYAVLIITFILQPTIKGFLGIDNTLKSNSLYYFSFLSNFDIINIFDNFFGHSAMSQNVTWSVSVEEQFYLLWPLIFFLPRKSWIYIILLIGMFSLNFRHNNSGNPTILYFHTFSVLIDLIIGGLAALIIKEFDIVYRLFQKTNTASHLTTLSFILFVLFYGTEFIFGEYNPIFGRLIKSILFTFLIASLALTKKISFLSLNESSILIKMGKITYSIYLLHPIIMNFIDVCLRNTLYKQSFTKSLSVDITIIFLTFIISWFSYKYFELFFLKLKRFYR
ncbi:acyltransferase [Flammeovirga sp. SubArs3]|uniref:acyltransferase family protein n=1 Tax=Flammeovirga sp. SubArs3 TaxID=2995316 RepID=UPI00248CD0B9|nr:acyltransferase [Flammeovirga sp. SubArs3]